MTVREGDAAIVEQFVDLYKKTLNDANTALADSIWQSGPKTSMVHPRGDDIGWETSRSKSTAIRRLPCTHGTFTASCAPMARRSSIRDARARRTAAPRRKVGRSCTLISRACRSQTNASRSDRKRVASAGKPLFFHVKNKPHPLISSYMRQRFGPNLRADSMASSASSTI